MLINCPLVCLSVIKNTLLSWARILPFWFVCRHRRRDYRKQSGTRCRASHWICSRTSWAPKPGPNREKFSKKVPSVSGFRIRIRIVFGSWIWIRIRVKRWIWIRVCMSKFRSFRGSKWSHGGPWTLKLEAKNWGVEAQNRGLEGLQASGRRFASPWWGAGSRSALNWKAGSGSALKWNLDLKPKVEPGPDLSGYSSKKKNCELFKFLVPETKKNTRLRHATQWCSRRIPFAPSLKLLEWKENLFQKFHLAHYFSRFIVLGECTYFHSAPSPTPLCPFSLCTYFYSRIRTLWSILYLRKDNKKDPGPFRAFS